MEDLTAQQTYKLEVSVETMIAIFSAVLLVAIYNIVVYLAIGRRYKMFLLSMFYICALLVIIPRIISLSCLLEFLKNGFDKNKLQAYYTDDIVSTYFRAIMGVYQIVSMFELKWRL